MFGRNWKNKEDYADIENYPPPHQAWEFLRRKPGYQTDCEIIKTIHQWIERQSESDIEELIAEANNRIVTGKVLLQRIYGTSTSLPKISKEIEQLHVDDVKAICQRRPVFWLLPRHDLSDWLEPLPPMPEEDNPKDIGRLFLPLKGGEIFKPRSENSRLPLPNNHVAVLIDLEQPIPSQIKGLNKRLEQHKSKLKKSDIIGRKPSHKKIPLYVQILDALKEKDTDDVYRELYEIICPEKYKKNQGDLLEVKANDYIGKRKKLAGNLRDIGYNIIANRNPLHSEIVRF